MAPASDALPDPATDRGRRVRDRLRTEPVAWLTLVSISGTPQPSPVGFEAAFDSLAATFCVPLLFTPERTRGP